MLKMKPTFSLTGVRGACSPEQACATIAEVPTPHSYSQSRRWLLERLRPLSKL